MDLLLIALLGFLGSFGHCITMCGPLTAAVALSSSANAPPSWWRSLRQHVLLNVGRLCSYALVGVAIGGFGSLLLAGGQLAGIGSPLRRGTSLLLGMLLIWIGLSQIHPNWLPSVPLFQPLLRLHQHLGRAIAWATQPPRWWTSFLLGLLWGLIPCGFLYIAQIKAVALGDPAKAAVLMLAFGVGTVPTMLGTGLATALVSHDRRSQLARLGGWVTVTIGISTLCRTDAMTDYSGYGALVCLIIALLARPISHYWAVPLRYRRVLGVSAFVLSIVHLIHMLDHSLNWNLRAITFLLPSYQLGLAAGAGAIVLMLPAALTSTDAMVDRLGSHWRKLHLLAVPALLLVAMHTILVGSHYLGALTWTWQNWFVSAVLVAIVAGVLGIRARQPVGGKESARDRQQS